jgi:uncharacterized membrane protein YeaQ/YmgE (transglycosylase-associated protein family)
MTLPSLIIGFLISTLCGSIFHLWRGGGPSRIILYLVLAWFGFWVGHVVANLLGWTFLSLGPLRLGTALFGSVILLLVGYWLSLVEVDLK